VSMVIEAKTLNLFEGFEGIFTLHSFMVRARSSDVNTNPSGTCKLAALTAPLRTHFSRHAE